MANSFRKMELIDKIMRKQESSKGSSNDRNPCNSNWIGDGYCDSDCNNSVNNFDNGDCCPGEYCSNPCDNDNIWSSYFGFSGPCICGDCYMYPDNVNEFDHGKCCCDGVDVVESSMCDGILGDVNNDGGVNIQDIVQWIGLFIIADSEHGEEGYINSEQFAIDYPEMDVNGDGFVDVMDVVTLVNLALNFEQSREERNLLNDIEKLERRNI